MTKPPKLNYWCAIRTNGRHLILCMASTKEEMDICTRRDEGEKICGHFDTIEIGDVSYRRCIYPNKKEEKERY
jgi:hypothetical protein